LLGKEFNFEVARSAALFGDLETVASEVNKQIGSAADFTEMNVIQQNALAKTFGLQREELADILVQQENLNKTRNAYVSLGEKTIEQLKTSGNIEKGVLKRIEAGTATASDYFKVLKDNESILEAKGKSLIQILGDESLASLQSQDAQSKFNDSLEKAKEVFSTFVDGGYLNDLADTIVKLVKLFGDSEGISSKQISQQLGANPSETTTRNTGVYGSSFSRETKIGNKGSIEEIRPLAFLDVISERLGDAFKVNILRGQEGEVMDWNLFSNGINEMNKNIKELNESVKRGGNVYMDGTQVGRATVMANSKMG
jgi:hypothetical protein